MKLYVCWGTFAHPAGHVHPCQRAFTALKDAGHDPEVIKGHGLRHLPDMPFNQSRGRQTAKRLTGSSTVPVLVTDDGEVITESAAIERWAQRHPARRVAEAPSVASHGQLQNTNDLSSETEAT